MAERSTLNQTIQIGVEATPGTSVAASKRLQSLGIEPNIETEVDQYRPSGQKFKALATLGKEWVTARLTGRGSYTEIVYALSSVIDTATITTPGGGTNSRNWNFTSDSFADDVPKTFTVEHGSSVRADKFTYGLITEFGMDFSRRSVEVTGSMIGQTLEDGITMTSSPTTIALIPVLPKEVSVYLDTTAAGLGTTKLTRAISAGFNIGNRFGPVWVLDAANPQFVNHIETEPDVTVSLKAQANAEGMGPLANLRAGSTAFMRIVATGSTIEAAIPYKFQADFAVKVADPAGFSDEDGVYGFEWNFVGVHDGTWGKAFDFNVVNTLTAL